MARKNKYDTHIAPHLDKIAKWVEQGATQAEVAKKLHIGKTTIKKYLALGEQGKEPYAAFAACFARACEVPDDNVEAAMYKRAVGIEYAEDTYCAEIGKDGEEKLVLSKRVTKYIPPDPTSAMFWLANRRPDRWKYKPEVGTDPDGQSGAGVVELPAVMDNPGPPDKDVTSDG